MIKVLIADDHPIVRQGLRQIFEGSSSFVLVGEASGGSAALDMLGEHNADVVLLDLNMPGMDGLEVLKRIRREYPRTKVLVLSVYPEEQYAVRVIRAGASGYMTKNAGPHEMLEAVQRVYEGGKHLSPKVAELLASEVGGDFDKPPHESLSDREFEVMRLLSLGKTVTRIAEELNLSPKTISTYRSRILSKMHLESNSDLTQYAIQYELIP
ncbi:response regulator transcription factor [Oceanidesulfovibrio marinus]|uniref:DNA-binding response regulator n=1 Tax=Oceanidesulfovibrio marinus TaxID=370038 RepID=A0A6P1ZFU8_9BACT|nr:response regulator transcription factor [Oceanidesulfovibrio marinus]QJT08492.1 response regulator transcription factor [Oceanidesulfovibrio marinus]TVM33042.1 DNA-binding response regulator [Oceanidesulfovibrio marinus]